MVSSTPSTRRGRQWLRRMLITIHLVPETLTTQHHPPGDARDFQP